ncbi:MULTISPECIES: carbohydrate kinase family protein [Rhizobium]|uniref:carbohydrate kinase family protein n=1 Tax=Rhizobium TaxID=379 RepID=UPI0013B86C08|nr:MULTISPECIES: carbohydrate kinase [Rhizobium]MCH4549526.1 carbohydrate kinase [Rhizobium changzhiense]NEI67693.1 carbohydrate kinase [Rhizobium leguminosarum]NKN01070.1 carbohydrate kinase [Rhizobium leguminosarum bv. viciae]
MIVVCGDALIDFLPVALPEGGSGYIPVCGGSCCNIATAIGRLGGKVGFMGGLSEDFFGAMLVQQFNEAGIDLRYATRLPFDTTLAFVRLGDDEPEYAFYDSGSAARHWTLKGAPSLGTEVDVLHIGSVTLIHPPVSSACESLFENEQGKRVLSIDPNCRPSLAQDPEAYRQRLNRLCGMADIVKLSVTDLGFMQPGVGPHSAAESWLSNRAKIVLVSRGAGGATVYLAGGRVVEVPARPARVVDTVGAGDALIAGFLTHLQQSGDLHRDSIGALTGDRARKALEFAAHVASLACEHRGSDPPWRREIIVAGYDESSQM